METEKEIHRQTEIVVNATKRIKELACMSLILEDLLAETIAPLEAAGQTALVQKIKNQIKEKLDWEEADRKQAEKRMAERAANRNPETGTFRS